MYARSLRSGVKDGMIQTHQPSWREVVVGRVGVEDCVLGLGGAGPEDEERREREASPRVHPPKAIVRATRAHPIPTMKRPSRQAVEPVYFARL